ncbi:possible p-aminobenzoate synthase, component I [Psychrobacter arcticus 273-4]|uniref:Possible p-aminobenzoate synthase, component I n=1 Tax=Psychrobacter arcticus (strain DSM 17307 / VKM B-2377 / 273-4) TaxID=259536 RepID=Q4FQG0_PSYA2|nr:anthranilate synthase component I family protein [Psychrobacter arcticus]AAZ19748.1 possible p-aminobenzoate synthase, component I [Psychrobacter arcticus 273-4]
MVVLPSDSIAQTDSALPPASKTSWRFGRLSAAELMPQLQRHLQEQDNTANWQLIWLNNDGQPVICLLPKMSWCVYPVANDTQHSAKQASLYKVEKTCRANVVPYSNTNTNTNTSDSTAATRYMSYYDWQEELIAYSQAYENNNDSLLSTSQDNQPPHYHHGLIGFIGYDIAAHELSPTANIELAEQPCALLGHYDIYLTADADNQNNWQLKVNIDNNNPDNSSVQQDTNALLIALISYLDSLDNNLSNENTNKKQLCKTLPLLLKAQWSQQHYQQAFNQTQHYLQQGDCYQINLTQIWTESAAGHHNKDQTVTNLIDFLPTLHANTQAPFAGYVALDTFNNDQANTANRQFELLSCSPELFFTFIKDVKTGKYHIRTKPIKGTMPRGINAKQDNDYKQQLIDSEKDRAENVMIVDLLRNDLGKYAKIGSVKVPQLFAIESFSNVHHMVSTITAELKTDTHPLSVLFGSLPAGSITGTPKKRAVEVIAELEAAPRGAYCGTMGYMNFDGSGQWNVLIRTLQATTKSDNTKQVSLWAGGGITVASDCDAEYQECLDKVGNLLSVLANTAHH